MPTPLRGEVWLVDLGMAAKVRPAVVVSTPFGGQDRSLITVVPHTTALSGSALEVAVQVSFLKPGAFLVQGSTTIQTGHALHRLGILPTRAFDDVIAGLLRWLGHSSSTTAKS
jgi:mRNA interferase MazF